MSSSYVVLPDDSGNSGKKARTITDVVGGNTLHTSVVTPAPTGTAPTVTSVTAASTSTVILASNVDRRGATVFNDADTTLYLKLGTSASATSHTVQILAGGYYELPLPCYTGAVEGIWASSPTGAARVTEIL